MNIDTLREANEVEGLHDMGVLNKTIIHSLPHVSIQYNNPFFVLPIVPFQIHCLLWMDDNGNVAIPPNIVTFDENQLIHDIYSDISTRTDPPPQYFLDHAILAP